MHFKIVVRLNQYGIHSNSFLSGQSDDDDDEDDDDYGDGELSVVDFSLLFHTFQILFEFTSGTNATHLALDDVTLTQGLCGLCFIKFLKKLS